MAESQLHFATAGALYKKNLSCKRSLLSNRESPQRAFPKWNSTPE